MKMTWAVGGLGGIVKVRKVEAHLVHCGGVSSGGAAPQGLHPFVKGDINVRSRDDILAGRAVFVFCVTIGLSLCVGTAFERIRRFQREPNQRRIYRIPLLPVV